MNTLRKIQVYESGEWVLRASMCLLVPGDVFRMFEPQDNSPVGELWLAKEFPVKNKDGIWEIVVEEHDGTN